MEYYNAMKRSRHFFFGSRASGSLLAGFAGGVVGTAFAPQFRLGGEVGGDRSGVLTPPAPVPLSEQALNENAQTAAVVERILPSVVSIAITKDLSKITQPQDISIRLYMNRFSSRRSIATGDEENWRRISGFLVSSDGLIVSRISTSC